jgi:hypothetical protein
VLTAGTEVRTLGGPPALIITLAETCDHDADSRTISMVDVVERIRDAHPKVVGDHRILPHELELVDSGVAHGMALASPRAFA